MNIADIRNELQSKGLPTPYNYIAGYLCENSGPVAPVGFCFLLLDNNIARLTKFK